MVGERKYDKEKIRKVDDFLGRERTTTPLVAAASKSAPT